VIIEELVVYNQSYSENNVVIHVSLAFAILSSSIKTVINPFYTSQFFLQHLYTFDKSIDAEAPPPHILLSFFFPCECDMFY